MGFAKGTQINLADGSKKPIEQIALGDVIQCDNWRYQRVVSIVTSTEKPITISMNGDRNLVTTATTPIMTKEGCKIAKEIQIGDLFLCIGCSMLTVTHVRGREDKTQNESEDKAKNQVKYNSKDYIMFYSLRFETEEMHYANDILVGGYNVEQTMAALTASH